jgi:DNA-binding response OmpR family regulator
MQASGDEQARGVLLVEDDLSLATLVGDWLQPRGYRVWHVDSAGDAARAVDSIHPDVIVLDLMLPDRSGLTLCSELKRSTGAPLIICSASRRKDDPVLGFQLGADDFLHKPFAMEELDARIELAVRRHGALPGAAHVASTSLRLGKLNVDAGRCEAAIDGQALALTPTEFRLLRMLADRAPDVVSRQDLADAIWRAVDDGVLRSLDVHVRRLRAKLRAARADIKLGVRRGFGYQLLDASAASAAA